MSSAIYPPLATRRIALNAFLLRSAIQPSAVFAEETARTVDWFLWDTDHLEPLNADEPVAQAASPDDIAVAIIERPSTPPAWLLLVREALNLPGFGGPSHCLRLAIFCAVEDPPSQAVRWLVYSFGTASHAIRKQAVEPRFGLITAQPDNGCPESPYGPEAAWSPATGLLPCTLVPTPIRQGTGQLGTPR